MEGQGNMSRMGWWGMRRWASVGVRFEGSVMLGSRDESVNVRRADGSQIEDAQPRRVAMFIPACIAFREGTSRRASSENVY